MSRVSALVRVESASHAITTRCTPISVGEGTSAIADVAPRIAMVAAAGTLNKRNSPVGHSARIAQTPTLQGFVYHVNNVPMRRRETFPQWDRLIRG
jgi:hypothetical protein